MKTKSVNVPKGLKKLHDVSMQCIVSLVKKGYKLDDAENMVMDTLKESAPYLQQGMVNETILSLKMIYLDYNLK